MSDTYNRSRVAVLDYLCRNVMHQTELKGSQRKPARDIFLINRNPEPGALVRLVGTADETFYLAWVLEIVPATETTSRGYRVESLETQERKTFYNVVPLELSSEVVKAHPAWRWSDAQWVFWERANSVLVEVPEEDQHTFSVSFHEDGAAWMRFTPDYHSEKHEIIYILGPWRTILPESLKEIFETTIHES
jgi:hypothetical protein